MNALPILSEPAAMTPLKAWRKGQLVDDADKRCRRTMRITDVERLYGIKAGTWHAWEQPVGHAAFRRPDDENMHRLFEITGGAILPEHFYPMEEWKAELASGG